MFNILLDSFFSILLRELCKLITLKTSEEIEETLKTFILNTLVIQSHLNHWGAGLPPPSILLAKSNAIFE